MVSKLKSVALSGLEGNIIEIETSISSGLPSFMIVGLPDTALQESKERVRAAIKNCGFSFPLKRVTVNLAPADIKKEGSLFDLGVALGILLSNENIDFNSKEKIFLGELALDGSLRPVSGVLAISIFAKENGIKEIFLPEGNKKEAALVPGLKIFPLKSIKDIFEYFKEKNNLFSFESQGILNIHSDPDVEIDFALIKGQEFAKRALEIAAAGGHNVIMSGPPGTGKTLLARAFPSILPEMNKKEILEVTKIYSVAGLLSPERPIIVKRPFRTPHHSASLVAITGGGSIPQPGEISLAHRGVLFLDEFPEFPRNILESLRQPLEDGKITVARMKGTITFPSRFTLLASKNPCPCGFFGDNEKECICDQSQIRKYQKKISGPILDRIDIHLEVPRLKAAKLTSEIISENSLKVKARVEKARKIQEKRFGQEKNIFTNSEMDTKLIKKYCLISEDGKRILVNAVEKLCLSPRAYTKIIKIARTISDLNSEKEIKSASIAEALQYRQIEN